MQLLTAEQAARNDENEAAKQRLAIEQAAREAEKQAAREKLALEQEARDAELVSERERNRFTARCACITARKTAKTEQQSRDRRLQDEYEADKLAQARHEMQIQRQREWLEQQTEWHTNDEQSQRDPVEGRHYTFKPESLIKKFPKWHENEVDICFEVSKK